MCLGGLLPRILCHTEWKKAVTVKGSAICWARWVRAEVPKGCSGSQACLPSSVSSHGASAFPMGKNTREDEGEKDILGIFTDALRDLMRGVILGVMQHRSEGISCPTQTAAWSGVGEGEETKHQRVMPYPRARGNAMAWVRTAPRLSSPKPVLSLFYYSCTYTAVSILKSFFFMQITPLITVFYLWIKIELRWDFSCQNI